MSKVRTGVVAITASLTTALVCGSAFQAANGVEPDTTSPTLSVQKDFLVGSQLSPSNLLDNPGEQCDSNDYTEIMHRISWTASDSSGIDDYSLWRTNGYQQPQFINWWSDWLWPDQYFTDPLWDYHGDCGGGSIEQTGWEVTAYDGSDNARRAWVGGIPYVIQENGTSASAGNDPSMFTYSGTWSTATGTFASGGRQVWTRQSGASVSFQVEEDDYYREVALVMAKGPGRGQAAIFIDGVRVSTVDTRAAANSNRIIVWTRDLTPGAHTIQIRNLATAGRPRIDFDAIVIG